jgi:2-oxoglutarate dehydrogenase E2 component (dihydrolipoamide succinyltransferase)
MLIEVKVPPLAESVADATLLAWQKKAGEAVHRGDRLIDLETDKVTLEIVAPENGVLKEVAKAEGATVVSDDLLAIIDTSAAEDRAQNRAMLAQAPASAKPAVELSAVPATAKDKKISPSARKLIEDNQVNPAAVAGSGPAGRVSKADVLSHLASVTPITSTPTPVQSPPAPAAPAPVPTAVVVEPTPAGARDERRVPMSRLRKRAAERLLAAQQENAILTTFNEVNMQAVMDLRKQHQESFQKRYGIKLGFLSFFAKAAVEALQRFPIVNASVEGEEIVYHDYYDLGMAVSTERGLVVPVVRDVDRLTFAGIEQAVADLAQKARDMKLSLDELSGGTFTITNGGVFGSLMSTPILNPPQSAILGLHKVQERPVAENGAVVIRPMMYLALSYDHRIIDGREAVEFLVAIKELIEDPARLLLEV